MNANTLPGGYSEQSKACTPPPSCEAAGGPPPVTPDQALSVVSWLDSLRACSKSLASARGALEAARVIGEGPASASVVSQSRGGYEGDKVLRIIERREEEAERARAEIAKLEPAVRRCADFISRAARESGNPLPYRYLLKYYAEASTMAEAAEAAETTVWRARTYPRRLAPALYNLDPGRFPPVSGGWGLYGYWEF